MSDDHDITESIDQECDRCGNWALYCSCSSKYRPPTPLKKSSPKKRSTGKDYRSPRKGK